MSGLASGTTPVMVPRRGRRGYRPDGLGTEARAEYYGPVRRVAVKEGPPSGNDAVTRKLVTSLSGLIAILLGGMQLLFVLPWAAIQNPRLELSGLECVVAVAAKLFADTTAMWTLLGLGLVFAGVALTVQATFPSKSELRLGPREQVLTFWGTTVVATLALLVLLVSITFMVL